jgi:hypothetical protein
LKEYIRILNVLRKLTGIILTKTTPKISEDACMSCGNVINKFVKSREREINLVKHVEFKS